MSDNSLTHTQPLAAAAAAHQHQRSLRTTDRQRQAAAAGNGAGRAEEEGRQGAGVGQGPEEGGLGQARGGGGQEDQEGCAPARRGARLAANGCRAWPARCTARLPAGPLAPPPTPPRAPPPTTPAAGALQKAPKRPQLKEAHKEALELTKAINADNEEHFAAQAAAQPGGKLSVVRGPPSLAAGGAPLLPLLLLAGRAVAAAGWQALAGARVACARTREAGLAAPRLPAAWLRAGLPPSGRGGRAAARRTCAAGASFCRATALPCAQLKAPVAATADQKQKAKKSLKPGNVHGFARQ